MAKSWDQDQDWDDLDLGWDWDLSTYSSNLFNSRRTHDANYKYLYYGSTTQGAQLHGPNHRHYHHRHFRHNRHYSCQPWPAAFQTYITNKG